MSKQREPWWPYVKNVLRSRPRLEKELRDRRSMSVTTSYNSTGRGSGAGRKTETAALKELSPQRMNELNAISTAEKETKRLHRRDGTAKTRLDLIEKTYYAPGGKLQKAADECYISYPTAVRYQGEFFRIVARELKLL